MPDAEPNKTNEPETEKVRLLLDERTPAMLIALVVVSIAADWFFAVLASSGGQGMVLIPLLMGLYIGQTFLAILVAGYGGRSWAEGMGISVAGSMIALLAALHGMMISSRFARVESLATLLILPAAMLIISLPLSIGRAIRGTRFVHEGQGTPTKQRLTIESFLIFITIIASSFFTLRSAMVIWDLPQPGPMRMNLILLSLMPTLVVGFIYALIVVLPIAAITSRRRDGMTVFITCIGLHAWIPLLLAGSMFRMGASEIGYFFFGAIAAGIYAALVIVAFQHWGLTLVSNARTTEIDEVRESETATEVEPRHALDAVEEPEVRTIWFTPSRRWALAFLLFAVIGTSTSAYVLSERSYVFVEQLHHQKSMAGKGGYVAYVNADVVAMKMPPETTDEDLRALDSYSRLECLDLSGTKITNGAILLINKPRRWTFIDLSDTDITDASMSGLSAFSFGHLSLARTKVTEQGLRKLSISSSLDMSGLKLTASSISNLNLRAGCSLALRDCGLSDEDIKTCAEKLSRCNGLDLSDNPLNGECLTLLKNLRELTLQRVDVDDQALKRALDAWTLFSLTLAKTKVTDAILPALQKQAGLTELTLGDGDITEAGLDQYPLLTVRTLSLHSRQFTGSCIRNWPNRFYTVSLAGSGIQDSDIQNIAKVQTNTLILKDTPISDASIKTLASMTAHRIDLRGTKVTAAGIRKFRSLSRSVLILTPDQFSEAELRSFDSSYVLEFIQANDPVRWR